MATLEDLLQAMKSMEHTLKAIYQKWGEKIKDSNFDPLVEKFVPRVEEKQEEEIKESNHDHAFQKFDKLVEESKLRNPAIWERELDLDTLLAQLEESVRWNKATSSEPGQEEIAIESHGNQVVDFNEGSIFPCEVNNEVEKVDNFHKDVRESMLVLGEESTCELVAISKIDCEEIVCDKHDLAMERFTLGVDECFDRVEHRFVQEGKPLLIDQGNRVFDRGKSEVVCVLELESGFSELLEASHKGFQCDEEIQNPNHSLVPNLLIGDYVKDVRNPSDNFDLLRDRGKVKLEIAHGLVLKVNKNGDMVTMNKPSGMEGAVVGLSLGGVANFVWDPGDTKNFVLDMGHYWFGLHKFGKFIMIFDLGRLTWVDIHVWMNFVVVVFDPGIIRDLWSNLFQQWEYDAGASGLLTLLIGLRFDYGLFDGLGLQVDVEWACVLDSAC